MDINAMWKKRKTLIAAFAILMLLLSSCGGSAGASDVTGETSTTQEQQVSVATEEKTNIARNAINLSIVSEEILPNGGGKVVFSDGTVEEYTTDANGAEKGTRKNEEAGTTETFIRQSDGTERGETSYPDGHKREYYLDEDGFERGSIYDNPRDKENSLRIDYTVATDGVVTEKWSNVPLFEALERVFQLDGSEVGTLIDENKNILTYTKDTDGVLKGTWKNEAGDLIKTYVRHPNGAIVSRLPDGTIGNSDKP